MPVKPGTIGNFEVFKEFTNDELVEVASLCRTEQYEPGRSIFEEGTSADTLYLVYKGKVALDKTVQLGRSGSSRRATVSILGSGRALGWSSVVPPFRYTASGVCIEPTTVLAIDGCDLHDFMDRDPAAGLKLMRAVAVVVQGRMEATTNTLTYFLSIIAHELKSPIAAVENYLEVMLGGYAGEFSARQTRMLERCALRVKDLRSLINGILDLARMKPEDVQADFEWFDPLEICEEAVENVRLAAQGNGIKLKIALPPEFQPIVGARRRLRQVISNLLSNAIKFSPEGSTVTLRVWEEEDQLVIEIQDEGVGIEADEHGHIFEDFFRGQNTGEVTGSGLGLSISKKIVNAHRGKIWFESPYEEGKPGTKFSVAIPRDLATPNMKQAEWKAAAGGKED